jgi:hypothetical protein
MSKRPTKAQVKLRVDEILAIRLAGAEMPGVREYVREAEKNAGSPWHRGEGRKPLSDSQLWRYIAKADKAMEDSTRASRKKQLRRHLAKRGELYARAVNAGDYRTALAVLDSQAKLLGLADEEFAAQLNQMQRQLAELKARYVEGTPTAAVAGNAGGPNGHVRPPGIAGAGEAPP